MSDEKSFSVCQEMLPLFRAVLKFCSTNRLFTYKDSINQPLYSASNMNDEVIRIETGLPKKNMSKIVVKYVESHKHVLKYHSGWRVVAVSIEDQVLIPLMKLRQSTIKICKLASFWIENKSSLKYKLLYQNCMSTVLSRLKNSTSLPESFSPFPNCCMIINCCSTFTE